jgi:hypothetical protein
MDERDSAALLAIRQESARYLNIDVDLVRIVPKGCRKFCIALPTKDNASADRESFVWHITAFVQSVIPDAERMHFAGLCSLERDAAQITYLKECLSKKKTKKQ